jgi:hypothetical protein
LWGDEGSSRVQHAWTVDPQIVRGLEVGQAAYIHGGGCAWVQIARPKPSPLPLPPPPAQPAPAVVIRAQADGKAEAEQPSSPAALDDAFGAGARP